MAESTGITQPALLFIPDISGFTQFVNLVEINHGQAIIQELLETLIESNRIGMKVSEIEGDAIFFYRLGKDLKPEEIAAQCRSMFVAFHQQLRKYDMARICDCGACTAAGKMTLKIVAHQGHVSFYKVREHEKLFGPDVILVHRLLKNDIPEHEYMMATDNIPLEQLTSSGKKEFDWIKITKGSSTYEQGKVEYSYSPFTSLYNSIPEPPKPDVKLYRVKNPIRFEKEINAPIGTVYDALIDLPQRMNYMAGIKKVKVHDEAHNKINRVGTRHECVRETNSSDVITSNVERTEGMVSFSETAADMPMSCDYILEKKDDKTKFTLLIHLEIPLMKKIMFNLFMKKKLSANLIATIDGLKKYCEEKFEKLKMEPKGKEPVPRMVS